MDEESLQRRVLREIGGRHFKGAYGRVVEEVWEGADTLRVLRREPLPTTAGKVLHLHRHRDALSAANGDPGEEEVQS